MKKALLFCVMALISLSTFSQTSFADIAMSDGNMYPFSASYTVANGGSIYVPVSAFTAGTGPYWDLSSYQGVEFSFTCTANDLNKKMILRAGVVKADLSGVVDALKDVVFTTETQVVTYNLSEEPFASNSKWIWGFKNPWSGNDVFTDSITVNSIKALSTLTSVPKTSIDKDAIVDVYNITGTLVRKGIKGSEATIGLSNGIYIVGNKKMYVKNN
ncbi:MAG: hypothetical protein JW717_08600 [Marinilabiliaceae bacterium]|nr:hypothetical protein [Marinilabiliaceae bacterium]